MHKLYIHVYWTIEVITCIYSECIKLYKSWKILPCEVQYDEGWAWRDNTVVVTEARLEQSSTEIWHRILGQILSPVNWFYDHILPYVNSIFMKLYCFCFLFFSRKHSRMAVCFKTLNTDTFEKSVWFYSFPVVFLIYPYSMCQGFSLAVPPIIVSFTTPCNKPSIVISVGRELQFQTLESSSSFCSMADWCSDI